MAPVKQWVDQPVDGPLSLVVYPGANGASTMYEDDGKTFDYRKGEWMGLEMTWRDAARTLTLRLARGSRMLPPTPRSIEVRLADAPSSRRVEFQGKPLELKL